MRVHDTSILEVGIRHIPYYNTGIKQQPHKTTLRS